MNMGRRDSNRRDSGRRGSGRRDSGRGDYGRSSRPNNRDRGEVTMTEVTCSSCGVRCKVPFKPRSTKPLYCDECFADKGKGSSDKPSNRDLDVINEKLNKIMKALDIE